MAINSKDFTTLVREMAAAIQGRASKLVDMTAGSILLAFTEAGAFVGMWLQSLVLALLARTRAATSQGDDLKSWYADFGFDMLGAEKAVGIVTFSRFSTDGAVTIPAGSIVQTADGSQQYTTDAVASMAAGVSSADVHVTAVTGGAAGNAAAGQVTVIVGSMPGVDTVTNATAFVGGVDDEKDDDSRPRFRRWLAGLSKATDAAIRSAISEVRPGLTFTITANEAYGGDPLPGYFYVVVDDGTGAPSSDLLAEVQTAVEATRGLTIGCGVFAPVMVHADISLTISVAAGYNKPATVALVSAALADYLNTIALGTGLPYTRVAQIAYDASPGVSNVTNVLVNGTTADVVVTKRQVLKAGTLSVSGDGA